MDGHEAESRLGLDDDDFRGKLSEDKDSFDEMDGREASPKLTLNDGEFQAKLAQDKQELNSANSESAEGSMLGAITMGVGSLLPGVGGAVAGLGLLGGTGALAFTGIAKALDAAHESSENVGMTGQQLAAQEYSNSVQIQQAQETVAQAHEQAAQDAVSSAQSIEEAEMSLTSVEQNAAASQIEALQNVQQAQQGVQEATYSLSQANYDLGQAYVTARDDITNASDALADAKLNVQSATLAVAQAQYNELLVDQNAYSTDLDREQASLAVAQAKQQVTDATNAESQAQYQSNLLNSQGVSGSQTVIQAKEAQTQAQYGLTDASESYQDAVRNLALTESNNAEQVKQAQLQVTQAQEQAAYQQMMDAQSVTNAQRNLTDTIKEQQLEWASMESTSNSAANQFALDMSKLTPGARNFVNQVLSMSGAWHKLEDTAENSVLPGMSIWLRGIADLMPEVTKAVGGMGSAISDSFAGFGKALQSPEAAKTMEGLVRNGMEFADVVLPAFAGFADAVARLGSQNGAVTGLADVLAGIGRGLSGFANGLTPYIPEFDKIFEALGKIAAAIGPDLATDIGAVAKALVPLADLINGRWGGPFISGLAQAAAAVLVFKGAVKLLPGFLGDALGSVPGKIGKLLEDPLKEAASGIGGFFKSGFSQAKEQVASDLQWIGGQAKSTWTAASGWMSGFASSVGSKLSTAGSTVAEFATGFGSKMVSAGQSAVQFVAGLGSQLATAARATVTWIAENTAAAAEYIATNVAMAASATVAFVAENAATLGLVAVIGGLVTAIVYMATHWKQTWTDLQNWTEDAYSDVIEPVFHGIADLAAWLYDTGIKPQFDLIADAADFLWHDVFDPFYQANKEAAEDFVSAFSATWERLESVFKTPVNFLIGTVYDNGIRRFWNDVTSAVGLGSLNLKYIAPLAHGGVIPGYNPGHDTEPAMLSKGEAVLTPDATNAIGGASTVNALNKAYPPSGGGAGSSLGKMALKEVVRHVAERPSEHAATLGHFSLGGIVGDVTDGLGSLAHDVGSVVSGAIDAGRLVADLMSGNTSAFTSTLGKLIGTPAAGTLAKVMVALPKTVVSDMATALVNTLTGGGNGTASGGYAQAGSVSGNVASWMSQAVKAAGKPVSWIPGLEEIAHYESGDNPYAVNDTPAGIAAGRPEGIMQMVMGTFLANHVPGTSDNIFDPIANIASSTTYIGRNYGSPEMTPGLIAVSQGKAYSYYDAGGSLPPGATLAVNATGSTEEVLTPAERAAWVALVKRMLSQPQGTSAGTAPNVTVQYIGTQVPSLETQAIMNRNLALALSGG